MTPRALGFWLHLIFAFSGASGLALQLSWIRRMGLGLGQEWPVALGVIGAFFSGLAMGSAIVAPLLLRAVNRFRAAIILEGIIGTWAWISIPVITLATALANDLPLPLNTPAALQGLLSFIIAALVLLPATCAMGATFPVMQALISQQFPGRRWIGSLYAANTAGAVAGTILAGWYSLPLIGFRGTTALFGGLNLVCAALLAWLGSVRPEKRGATTIGAGHSNESSTPINSITEKRPIHWSDSRKFLASALLATGFLGIGYEIVIARLLGQVLENTFYSYAILLIVFLTGTTLGAAAQSHWDRTRFSRGKTRDAYRGGARIQGPLASLAAVIFMCAWTISLSPGIYESLRLHLGDQPAAVLFSEFVTGAVVFLPPTFLMGAMFSELLERAVPSGLRVSSAVALNTAGATLAPLLVGVLLIPWLGARNTLIVIVASYGILLTGLNLVGGLGIAIASCTLFLAPQDLRLLEIGAGGRIVASREGVAETVTVHEFADRNRVLRANNRFGMGGTASASAERRHSHIPLLLHPSPRRALFLGVGTGISFAAMDAHPNLQADGIELVPEIVELKSYFAPYNDYSTERLQVVVADARRFVRSSRRPYDVIVADLFHPARDGAGTLYTREHFQAVRGLLTEHGIFCQWLPLYQLNDESLRIIIRTFLDVFSSAEAFLLRPNVDVPVLGLISGISLKDFGPGWLEQRVKDPRLREQLQRVGLVDDLSVFGLWLADTTRLRRLAANSQVNTDDRPVLLYSAPAASYSRRTTPYLLLQQLLRQLPPQSETTFGPLDGSAESTWRTRIQQYRIARDLYLEGLIAESERQGADAEELFLKSVRASSDFTTSYAHVLRQAAAFRASRPAVARRLLEALDQARPERPVAREFLQRLDQAQ